MTGTEEGPGYSLLLPPDVPALRPANVPTIFALDVPTLRPADVPTIFEGPLLFNLCHNDPHQTLAHEMVNEETQEVAARTFLTGVCLDTKTRKARPLPADVRERIAISSTDGAHHKNSGRLRKQEA